MKLLVRKDVFDEIIKSYIARWGYPGHYRYKYYEPDKGYKHGCGGLTKQNSGIDQNKLDAMECNTAPEIKPIPLLKCNRKNYLTEGLKEIQKYRDRVHREDVFCKATGQKIADINGDHLYKDARDDEEKYLRTRLLPYLMPIIEQYGKKGSDSRPMKFGNSVCLLAKTKIINEQGFEQKIGIKVVLAPDKNNNLELDFISLYSIENKLIKSIDTDTSTGTCHISGVIKK